MDTSYWTLSSEELFQKFRSSAIGLSSKEAHKRLQEEGSNHIKAKRSLKLVKLFISQFLNPFIGLLIVTAFFLFFYGGGFDALIISMIIVVSGVLSFWQEKGAGDIVEKLLSMVQTTTEVVRDGKPGEIPLERVVSGDVVILNAGDIIPGDGVLIEVKDLFVDEGTLTGESHPAEKSLTPVAENTPFGRRTNCLFMGTHVMSGMAKILIVATGNKTLFGQNTFRLTIAKPEASFEKGIRKFGYFLLELTFILTGLIFSLNIFLHRPFLEALLFSLAIAIGLTPQLLPAIISVNLAYGAKYMASKSVIVKKLASIENFGSMNILCSDKTGTLTEGKIHLKGSLALNGASAEKVGLFSYLNAHFQQGYVNPLDLAILEAKSFSVEGWEKTGEVPYNFCRKRLSIGAKKGTESYLITKGAYAQILSLCSQVETPNGEFKPIQDLEKEMTERFEMWSKEGIRVLALCYKKISQEEKMGPQTESEMTFLGWLLFEDPLKKGAMNTIRHLRQYGVMLKMITGDNQFVANHVATSLFTHKPRIVTGDELRGFTDEALINKVNFVDVFAEVEPTQKERIIMALRKAGHIVGYIGDGINDVTAMHSADVSLSVNQAIDCAKEAADMILLKKDLSVILEGIKIGRKTFWNTMKYLFMATSANFGNMFSMAGASLLLPFLPLLPAQVLLTNLLTDLPEMAICTDNVDEEMIQKPLRWDLKGLQKFMWVFGLISSVFDYLTFGSLLFILHASIPAFRTGWFVESVISAILVVMVIRTRKSIFKSAPSKLLALASFSVVIAVLVIPFIPLGHYFSFVTLPWIFYPALFVILLLYGISAELAKKFFYRKLVKKIHHAIFK